MSIPIRFIGHTNTNAAHVQFFHRFVFVSFRPVHRLRSGRWVSLSTFQNKKIKNIKNPPTYKNKRRITSEDSSRSLISDETLGSDNCRRCPLLLRSLDDTPDVPDEAAPIKPAAALHGLLWVSNLNHKMFLKFKIFLFFGKEIYLPFHWISECGKLFQFTADPQFTFTVLVRLVPKSSSIFC